MFREARHVPSDDVPSEDGHSDVHRRHGAIGTHQRDGDARECASGDQVGSADLERWERDHGIRCDPQRRCRGAHDAEVAGDRALNHRDRTDERDAVFRHRLRHERRRDGDTLRPDPRHAADDSERPDRRNLPAREHNSRRLVVAELRRRQRDHPLRGVHERRDPAGNGQRRTPSPHPDQHIGDGPRERQELWVQGPSDQRGGERRASRRPTAPCIPVGPPGAATAVVSSGVDGMALVSWTAPASNGGSAIQTYTVTASPGGGSITVQAPITSAVVRGLTNGTPYSFSVVATNALGTSSPASTAGTVQPTAGARAIAFTSTRTGSLGQDIYLMDEAGTVTVQLIRRNPVDTAPRFSPDHSQIAFTSFTQGSPNTSDIWLMNVDGTGLQRLTTNSRDDGYANWSPDGTKLVFASNRTQDNGVTQSDREIWVMNADGSGTPKELTRTAATVPDEYPDWSPDGSRIVFSSIRGGETDTEIYAMNASDGLNIVKLTNDQVGGATIPVWSAGSHPRIALHVERAGRYQRDPRDGPQRVERHRCVARVLQRVRVELVGATGVRSCSSRRAPGARNSTSSR